MGFAGFITPPQPGLTAREALTRLAAQPGGLSALVRRPEGREALVALARLPGGREALDDLLGRRTQVREEESLSLDREEAVIAAIQGIPQGNGPLYEPIEVPNLRGWDLFTRRLGELGGVREPMLHIWSRGQIGNVRVATGHWGERESLSTMSGMGWHEPGRDVPPNASHMWLVLILVGDTLRTYHSESEGVVRVRQVEGGERPYFMVKLLDMGGGVHFLISPEGEFLGAYGLNEDEEVRLVANNGEGPELEYEFEVFDEENKNLVPRDQGENLNENEALASAEGEGDSESEGEAESESESEGEGEVSDYEENGNGIPSYSEVIYPTPVRGWQRVRRVTPAEGALLGIPPPLEE